MIYTKPEEIERRSMEIIEEELNRNYIKLQTIGIKSNAKDEEETEFTNKPAIAPETLPILKRVIHTTADFSYAETLTFSENVVTTARQAIKNGASILTDTEMARAGINKRRFSEFGGEVHCLMANSEVIEEAKRRGTTRAAVSMEKSVALGDSLIYAIGNAPTALFTLCDLIEAKKITPALIIGVPVGFVNVVEAKERLLSLDVPYIVARGRKGGSNVAAAIVNALLYGI